ncbi:Required for respiratory growth protein 9 mitochondrial [Xylographa carneopallida]|nr:Required for respiratory growth protein 9 mitochondrial [Xylographa carneopallida]
MSCSACRVEVLRYFLCVFGPQHAKLLPGRARKTIQRRAIHSGTVRGISSTSVKSTALGVHDVTPTATSDHYCIPFTTSSASTSIVQSASSSAIQLKKPIAVKPLQPERKEDHLFEDAGLLEPKGHEPDVILFPESKSRRLVRDGLKDKISSSGSKVKQTHERRSYKQDGRTCSGRRAPTTIHETEEKVAKFTAEKVTAGTRPHNPQEPWGVQKSALEQKFGEKGWAPRKRLSPDALDGIRALHAQYPEDYSTSVLAEQFKVSPEAIRRILKSKWRPNDEEDVSRRQRWQKRGELIWGQMVDLGLKPPKKWRNLGIGRINNSDGGREKARARSRNVNTGDTAPAAVDDLVKVPKAVAQADQLARRSLSDRIL